MRDRYLTHITLTSGDSRRSPRSEVDEAVIDYLAREVLPAALRGYAPLPVENPRCVVNAAATDDALVATVWESRGEARGAPIITIGIAAARSPEVWALLHRQATTPVATDPSKPPNAPWCAARLEVGAALHAEAMEWVADFERCLAWAFLRDRPRD